MLRHGGVWMALGLGAIVLAGPGGRAWAAPAAGEAPEQFRVWGARAATHPYLGDPGLDAPGPLRVEATEADKARGFAVFARPATALARPDEVRPAN